MTEPKTLTKKYLAVDAQYFLVRNLHACKKLFKTGDHSLHSKLMTSFFYSMFKLVREVKASKIILLWDRSPYHKQLYLDGTTYKGDRHYYTRDDLDKDDISIEEEENIKHELYLNEYKQKVKWQIIKDFGMFGMPSVLRKGYEGDDLAYLFCNLKELEDQRIVITSIDGDWKYLIKKNSSFYNPRSRKTITYDEITNLVSHNDPYEYKSTYDSLFGSHNYLQWSCYDKETDRHEITKSVLDGNESYIDNNERFKSQMRSFDVYDYPEIDFVLEDLRNSIAVGGLQSESNFDTYCTFNSLKITSNYYSNNINLLDRDCYGK